MRRGLALVLAIASITLVTNTALAQGSPPPGGGGGAPITVSDLGCGPGEIARVNAADEWECSADLTAAEAAAAAAQATADTARAEAGAAQTTANAAQSDARNAQITADVARAGAANAQVTADRARSEAANAQTSADVAFGAARSAQEAAWWAAFVADDALGRAVNAQTAADTAQSVGDMAQNNAADAQNRIGVLEGQNLDARVFDLEADSLQFSRIVIVKSDRLTALDNGLALQSAIQTVNSSIPAPSSTARYTILLEPGEYDLGSGRADIPGFTNLRGVDRLGTIILSEAVVLRVSGDSTVESLKLVSRTERAIMGASGTNLHLNDVSIEAVWGMVSGTAVEATNSDFTARFKCFSLVGSVKLENFKCNTEHEFLNIYAGDVVVNNSKINGKWVIFGSAGEATNIEINNSEVNGGIAPTNANPFPTQDVFVRVSNSQVSGLNVGFPGSAVEILHSEIANLVQSDGSLFASHSLIGNLNVAGGIGNIVNSQIDVPNITPGTISCPFSYDGSFLELSGSVC